ncbi:MAG: 2OG-Fe(II) oxygenase family protein [Caulobacter sp.]|nr:2OG-Fe(II) oxygenase family protein [Caulobacter sp.]
MSDSRILRLNPALNPADYAEAFQRDGYVRIPEIFEPDTADAIAMMLEQGTPWIPVISDAKGREEPITREIAERLGPAGVQERLKALMAQAREGFAYSYLHYPMLSAYLQGQHPGHPLHVVTEYMNGREFLDFGQAVIGHPHIVKADVQASFYRPGDFLNLHDDLGDIAERRAAYTLGFARRWRPDWGGQLLIHDAQGGIARGFAPSFNAMTLFKVPTWHSVAPVASFAGGPRLSITGWLRDDPPAGG